MSNSPSDYLERAMQFHRKKEYDRADRFYSKFLKQQPESVDGLHFHGLLKYEQGDVEQGIAMISAAIDRHPGYVDAWINLGNILLKLGELREAHASYARALQLAPDRIDTLSNMGILLKHLNQLEQSEQLLERVAQLKPDWAEAWHNLANTQALLGKLDRALANYRRSIDLNTSVIESYSRYTTLCYITERESEALGVYEKWMEREPDNPVLQHMFAALGGSEAPDRMSQACLKRTFDRYAGNFESSLHRLDYAGPGLLAGALETLSAKRETYRILDACCGTGLAAEVLKPYAIRLAGVDISEKMLEQAESKQLYDKLVSADVVEYLGGSDERWDLVVSLDALIYFGDLRDVVVAVSDALDDRGTFIFTLEKSLKEASYELCPHGRYAHSRAYVEQVLEEASLDVGEIRQVVIRKENRDDVLGWLCVACKRSPRHASAGSVQPV